MAPVVQFSLEDRDKLKGLLSALDLFTHVRPDLGSHDIPVQMIRTFLTIAIEEGLGPNEISRRMDVASAVGSRHVVDLGEFNRCKDDKGQRLPGYNLIEQKHDVTDRRTRKEYLTASGRGLRTRLLNALRG
jgi:DNA-binding MarR family transcriptional regulator